MPNQINKQDYYKKFATVSVNNMVMSTGAKCCKCKENVQEFTYSVSMKKFQPLLISLIICL